ncbi:MAG: helix-turn-helix domain-containing protein [Gemmatimonadota bacterium]
MGLAAIAAWAGYETEAAFSRAFKRFVGVPPGAYRRAGRPPAEDEAPRRASPISAPRSAGIDQRNAVLKTRPNATV